MLDDIFEIFKMIFVALKIFFRIDEDYIIQKEGIIEDEKVEMLSSDYSNEDHESVCFYVDLLK